MLSMLASADPVSHVVQQTLIDLNPNGGFWSMPIMSNHIFMQLVGAALLVWMIPKAVQMRAGNDGIGRLVPRGFGTAIELVCVGLRDTVFKPNLGKYSDMFTPYLWSLFFFVLIANVLGLFPLSDWFFFVPGHLIGGTSTANFYVTGTLAVITLILIVYNGLRFHGMEYIKHFFLGPWWISWFIAPLEVLSTFIKSGALCIRLTANMLAGHIMLAVLYGFIATAGGLFSGSGLVVAIPVIGTSVLMYFLEILVAFMHAFIFTTLTTVFIGMAVNIHHDDDHAHDDAHAEGVVAAAH